MRNKNAGDWALNQKLTHLRNQSEHNKNATKQWHNRHPDNDEQKKQTLEYLNTEDN